MGIKFWNSRHRAALYNVFDEVRLRNFSVLDVDFVRDMLYQKLTDKAYRRIESEWCDYWYDVFEEEPSDGNYLLVHRISQRQLILLKVNRGVGIAQKLLEKYPDIFSDKVVEIEDE